MDFEKTNVQFKTEDKMKNKSTELAQNPPFCKTDVMRSAGVDAEKIIKTEKWKEFHDNGQLWIDGEIALIKDEYKHLFDYRTGFKNYEGQPVVRIGVWSKYFDNGQIAWQCDFTDGMYDSKVQRKKFPSYRKDGTVIVP